MRSFDRAPKKKFVKKGAAANAQRKRRLPQTRVRFKERGGKDWTGPIIDYKEIELLRKVMSGSGKIMSRKRAGTNAREQRDIRRAIKHARFIGLLPFTGA